jgi:outer membrane protein OmpA-like peptidoglycan-associated protein
MAVALVALSALSSGCCDNEKKQIGYLTQQNLELGNKNKELQGRFANAQTRESQLMSELDSKDLRLTSLQTENQELKRQLGARPTPGGPPAAGAEVAVYTETLASDLVFAAGKASLSSAGKSRLDSLVSLIKSKYGGMGIRVYGYTDSDPIRHTKKLWTDNLDLSANRAMAVTRYLRSKGIAAERVETVAMGDARPVAANSSQAGKARNRRVEIVVVKG